jgi:hypothetical protein
MLQAAVCRVVVEGRDRDAIGRAQHEGGGVVVDEHYAFRVFVD